MYMAVLPYWHKNAGDRLSMGSIPEEMEAYCKFLGQRYAGRNIFWILGGDSTAAGEAGVLSADSHRFTRIFTEGLSGEFAKNLLTVARKPTYFFE
jgi:hypothetical protein